MPLCVFLCGDQETGAGPQITEELTTHELILGDSFYVPSHLFPYLKAFCITCYSTTVVVGLIGNSLVILVAGFKMKTVSAVWFLNLAIADFICCAFLPIRIREWVLFDGTVYPDDLCLIPVFILILSMCSSVYFLTLISLDRCVSILWPMWSKVHRTSSRARVVSGIVWAVCLLLSGPIAMYWLYVDFSDCVQKSHQAGLDYAYLSIKVTRHTRLIFMFVLPFIVILVSYALIFNTLRKRTIRKSSSKSYRIGIAVVVCFFICWFPYYIWPFLDIGNENEQIDNLINEICITVAYFNSCINPILYVLLSQDFKNSFIKTILARLENVVSEKYEMK
ncbi:C3a anaphylatoxin chemotactic receptor-like [Gastrophryne carolinensis]